MDEEAIQNLKEMTDEELAQTYKRGLSVMGGLTNSIERYQDKAEDIEERLDVNQDKVDRANEQIDELQEQKEQIEDKLQALKNEVSTRGIDPYDY